MNLTDFIRANTEKIMQQWEAFARTIASARELDVDGLRDHAKQMLQVIADDMGSAQTKLEQSDKSKGLAEPTENNVASEQHGLVRLQSGFTINEMISEFRALRASVLALWSKSSQTFEQNDIEQMTRFNEAIDQSITQSVSSYSLEKSLQNRLFATMLAASPDQVYILDLQSRFVFANKAVTDLYEMTEDELKGKTHFDLEFPFAESLQQYLQQVIDTGEIYRGELSHAFAKGLDLRLESILAPVMDENGQVEMIVGITRDITERKTAEEQSWHNANYDLLTGFPNRRLFRDRLEQDINHSLRTGYKIALMFIDLDRFKEVNDLLGHEAGDMLLLQAAQRIQSCVRATDTVARLGGDEFTVILNDLTATDQVDELAQKIIEELVKPFHILQNVSHISGSIGITLYPQDATTPEDLVRNADQAMYVAKSAGRNQFSFFKPTTQEVRVASLKLLADLRQALPQRELVVYYQPIIDLANDRIIKAEALLRWHHPERGLIFPDAFIHIAEETGLINEIGKFVFAEAAARSHEWGALLGKPFQISINKSPVEFMSRASAMDWQAHLLSLGLAAGSIAVEVTEGVLLNASPIARENFASLQQADIELAIDDFGTGYSSMAYLKKFEIDYLKIDQSFVQDRTEASRIIAETVIVMAHKLGLKVIAEGVETPAQRDWLLEAGCDYAQGYLYSKAVPAEEFSRLLQTGSNAYAHRVFPVPAHKPDMQV